MEEDREKERLPYPVMDIDFLRREQHSRSGSQYISVIVATIHYLVEYRCCFCDAWNRDEDQVLELKTYTQSSDAQTRIEKEEKVVRDLKDQGGRNAAARMEKYIATREYELLELRCRCAQCGKKQPWANFWPVDGMFRAIKSIFVDGDGLKGALFIFLCIFLGYQEFCLLGDYPLAGIGIIFLLFVPGLAAIVHNRRIGKKCQDLAGSYRPEIRIVYKSED